VARFDEGSLLVVIVCGNETKDAVEEFGRFTSHIGVEITKNKNAEAYRQSGHELALKLFALRAALRKELGIDPVQNRVLSSG
jgi:hypothetical protein